MMKKFLNLAIRISIINFLAYSAFIVWDHSQPIPAVKGQKTPQLATINSPSPGIQPEEAQPQSAPTKTPSANKATSNQTSPPTVSLANQVSQHNRQSDCWVTYNGGIYNITGYFGRHPGGDAIMAKYCGGDITGAFNTMEKITPKAHSQAALQMLEAFRI